jgi:hypothetical protein
MSEITLALKEKGLIKYLEKHDKRDTYGDDDNFWLNLNQNIEECTFDGGCLNISFNYDEDSGEPYVSVRVPLAELLYEMDRLDVIDDMESDIFKNGQSVRKLVDMMKKIKEARQKELEEHIKKMEEENKAKKK